MGSRTRRPWYQRYYPGWIVSAAGGGGGAATVQTDGVTIQGDGSAGNKIAIKAVQTNASLAGAGTVASTLSVSGAPITGWCTLGKFDDQSTVPQNQLWLIGLFLPIPITFSKIGVNIVTADNANNSDVGFYNAAGTLIANAGAQHMGATGFRTFSTVQGAQTAPAGVIFIAATTAGAALQLKQQDGGACLYSNTNFGSSAGGALPASITPPALAPAQTPYQFYLL